MWCIGKLISLIHKYHHGNGSCNVLTTHGLRGRESVGGEKHNLIGVVNGCTKKDLLTKVKQKFQFLGAVKKATQIQAAVHLKMETAATRRYRAGESVVVQGIQVGFHRSVVDAQELIGGGHHVDSVRLAFGAFLVHKLVDWFIRR